MTCSVVSSQGSVENLNISKLSQENNQNQSVATCPTALSSTIPGAANGAFVGNYKKARGSFISKIKKKQAVYE